MACEASQQRHNQYKIPVLINKSVLTSPDFQLNHEGLNSAALGVIMVGFRGRVLSAQPAHIILSLFSLIIKYHQAARWWRCDVTLCGGEALGLLGKSE